jgi:hypothetical protein
MGIQKPNGKHAASKIELCHESMSLMIGKFLFLLVPGAGIEPA